MQTIFLLCFSINQAMTQTLENKIKEKWDKYQCEMFDFAKMLMGSDAEATIRWCYLCTLFEVKANEYPELLEDDANVRSWLYYRMREICLQRQRYLNQNKSSWVKSISKLLLQLSNLLTKYVKWALEWN
jgi:hypothetical protein